MTGPVISAVEITVDFCQPVFSGLDQFNEPEWPPSPFRLAQALMAGCCRPTLDAGARTALEALTRLENPEIILPSARTAKLPGTFTHRSGGPMEGSETKGKPLERILDLTVAGLSATNRTEKPQGRTLLADTQLVFRVADPEHTVDVEALDRAAARVPYFGRSHDLCDVTVSRADVPGDGPKLPSGCEHLVPVVDSRGTRGTTRGWAPNSCSWMDLNYATTTEGGQLPPFSPEPYLTRLTYRRARSITRPSRRVAILELRRPVSSPQIPELLARVLGSADLTSLGVTAFPCVTAGHQHADGRLRGIGLFGDDSTQLREAVRRLRDSEELSSGPPDLVAKVVDPAYWERTSRHWVSATPLRGFPDIRVVDPLIRDEVKTTTGEFATIGWSNKPERRWQYPWRQPPDGHSLWWARLTFAQPVPGPLLFGRTTEKGFGLLVPEVGR